MINTIAQWLVLASGVWLIAISILMVFNPQTALGYLGKMASTDFINYSELTLRLIAGAALWRYSEFSKAPEVLNIIGLFLAATTVILFLVPRKWHAAYSVWWSKKLNPAMVRLAAPISLAAGVSLIYAVM
ncbi:MAG: hypothetical protein GXP06_06500 [Alphaproteobacteria bacterium]|nr:hypothetical protein [Alphaproteobacteria bacterium]